MSEITIGVMASDHGASVRSNTIDVIVTIEDDLNDMPPVWEDINGIRIDDYIDLYISEAINVGSIIARLKANTDDRKYFMVCAKLILASCELVPLHYVLCSVFL